MTTAPEPEDMFEHVYRERAALLAHIAAWDPFAAISYNSTQYPHAPVLYLRNGRMSWHINSKHLPLFAHVPEVAAEDPRVAYDGHSTDEKYARLHNETETIAHEQRQTGEWMWLPGRDGEPQQVQVLHDEAAILFGCTRTGKYETGSTQE